VTLENRTVLQYFLIFLAGLAGSAHCLGMCGGFVCVMGRDPRSAAATLRRHLLYNVGRVTTYCFLGAVAGYFSMLLAGHHAQPAVAGPAQRTLAVISGALMLYIGLQFFDLFRGRRWQPLGYGAQFLASSLRQLLKSPGPGAPLALGALNGFLPCPLVYAFVLQATTCGSPLPGLLTMAAFGLGTFPAMLAMGAVGMWLRPVVARSGAANSSGGALLARPDWRRHSLRIAGGFIVLLGAITFARGVLPMGVHLH